MAVIFVGFSKAATAINEFLPDFSEEGYIQDEDGNLVDLSPETT